MEMKERIQTLRKDYLHKTLEEFGDQVGLSKQAISMAENGKSNLSDVAIRSICREYHVREEWLRTGEGDMFEDLANDTLEDTLSRVEVSPMEANLIKSYFALPKETRQGILEWLKDAVAESEKAKTPAEMTEADIQAAGRDYMDRLRLEKRLSAGSFASSDEKRHA